jgi:hypothetical protein
MELEHYKLQKNLLVKKAQNRKHFQLPPWGIEGAKKTAILLIRRFKYFVW